MANIADELINKLITEKKYETIQEFASISHIGQKPIAIHEYSGSEIRAFEQDGNINILYPEKPTPIQESALAKAIKTGSIFDDAEEVSRGATYVRLTVIPARAFAKSNFVELPKQLTTLTKACIGQMDDDGRLPCSPACIENGYNFQKNMICSKVDGNDHVDIVRHHLGIPDSEEHLPKCIATDSYECHKGLDKMRPFNPEDSIEEEDYEEIDPTKEASDIVEQIEKSKLSEDSEKLPSNLDDNEDEDDITDDITVDDPDNEDIKDDDDDNDDDEDEDNDEDDDVENDDEDTDDDEDDDDKDDEDDEEKTIQESGPILTFPKNIKKKYNKLLSDLSPELSKLISLYESDRLTRGKIISMYKSSEFKYSTRTKLSDSYSIDIPRNVETDTIEMLRLRIAQEYSDGIIRKKRYSSKFSSHELSEIKNIETSVNEMIDDITSVLNDGDASDKLIKNLIKNARSVQSSIAVITGNGISSMPRYAKADNEDGDVVEEGFLSRRPKKLKPLPAREIISYITVELNAIRDSNDQAMLSGYTCSKLELVDFYINCLDTQDDRYVVPHNRAYLVQFQNDLNRLLTQILAIKPVKKQDRVWKVNVTYPEDWRM